MLKVQNLNYAYDHHQVLKNIHFEIEEGSIVGILGLSGSGKTTLLKILSGLIIPKEGEVTIYDVPTFENGKVSKILSQDMGVVFQQFNLFMHMSVVDNLALPLRLRTKQSKTVCRQKAIELLESLGLKDQEDKYPNQCSGGQQQRIAIARALILNPKLLLIDEPTSSLDKENTQILIDLLKNLHKQGLTIVLITHDLAFAKAMCERVVELKNGQIHLDQKAVDYFK